jgi:predicted enzyme related to lactoylglutathione lyase
MTVVTTHPPGEPTWVDLMTSDPDGARAFYGGLFDWTFDIGTPETFGYTMCFKGGHRVAGMGQKPPDMPMPTCWNVYLGTADVDATCEAIRQGGGTIVQPPMDIMEEGRMAFATDPTGAAFGLWQPRKHGGTQLVDEPGSFAWCELNTRDLAGAQAFLCELFGYEAREVPIPVTKYVTLHLAGHDEPIGGILQMNEHWEGVPPHWMAYFATDSTDAACERVTALGGKVCVPAFDTPYGRIAVVEDPQGGTFSLIQALPPA